MNGREIKRMNSIGAMSQTSSSSTRPAKARLRMSIPEDTPAEVSPPALTVTGTYRTASLHSTHVIS